MLSSGIAETNTTTSYIYYLWIYGIFWIVPVLSSIKTGFTSKLAARIDEEGILEDKGSSGSSKGRSGQSLLTRYTLFSVTTAHFPR